MYRILNITKMLLPHRVWKFLGDQQYLRALHRNLTFRRSVRQFLLDIEEGRFPAENLLSDLIYGWGNDWSAENDYLAGCIEHALSTPGPVLECGSGLTTILIGAIGQNRGFSLWSLEHKPEWASRVQYHLEKYQIYSVTLCVNPLKDYNEYCWYDPPLSRFPDAFTMVICDGPPGDIKGGRYGLAPVMKDKLESGCVILLDDANRIEEAEIAKRWNTEFSAPFETMGSGDPYFQIKFMHAGSI